mmetsp:Transcript_20179/g.20281  ORF Transcript_20179/g.20281 Transcript_20179/m.20281 type:complete len:416 (+) Transcript_20179:80-1327(+)
MSAFQESIFTNIPTAPANVVLGLAQECNEDTFKDKINLTIGAYRDEMGKPYVLPSVVEAEKILSEQNLGHEYLPQDGLKDFTSAAQVLLFGLDSRVLNNKSVYTIQGISGTGSLRLAGDFISKFFSDRTCYIPAVTWENHQTIFTACGVKIAQYRYLDATGCLLDFEVVLEDLKLCPVGSVILLHMCAHNPTGVDPSPEQWRLLLQVVRDRQLFPLFDNAYQGFVTGSPDEDAYPVRLFAEAGVEMFVACSFAKNFGLYGERVGALHVVSSSSSSLLSIASQLRLISRSLYSTCPLYGARIVSLILNTPSLYLQWRSDCEMMANRLSLVRKHLYESLIAHNTPGTWTHVIQQRGMFSFTGLSPEVVRVLKTEYHIYLLETGRISLAGLNPSNIERFASCVCDAINNVNNASRTNY